MLKIAKKLSELSFGNLMDVYEEGNLENARDLWPEESVQRQLALAEQEFHNYLSQVFFRTPGAFYALWEVQGRYVSALRIEPYEDGWLLEALETAPSRRRRGYAWELIQAVLAHMVGMGKIYSHVSKRNIPSLGVHQSCGFKKILDHAVYADGSVLSSAVTLMIEV